MRPKRRSLFVAARSRRVGHSPYVKSFCPKSRFIDIGPPSKSLRILFCYGWPPMLELAPGHKRGLSLASPLMNSSGILGWAGEARGLINFASLGALVTNAVTWSPRTPAHSPNALEVPGGVIIH